MSGLTGACTPSDTLTRQPCLPSTSYCSAPCSTRLGQRAKRWAAARLRLTCVLAVEGTDKVAHREPVLHAQPDRARRRHHAEVEQPPHQHPASPIDQPRQSLWSALSSAARDSSQQDSSVPAPASWELPRRDRAPSEPLESLAPAEHLAVHTSRHAASARPLPAVPAVSLASPESSSPEWPAAPSTGSQLQLVAPSGRNQGRTGEQQRARQGGLDAAESFSEDLPVRQDTAQTVGGQPGRTAPQVADASRRGEWEGEGLDGRGSADDQHPRQAGGAAAAAVAASQRRSGTNLPDRSTSMPDNGTASVRALPLASGAAHPSFHPQHSSRPTVVSGPPQPAQPHPDSSMPWPPAPSPQQHVPPVPQSVHPPSRLQHLFEAAKTVSSPDASPAATAPTGQGSAQLPAPQRLRTRLALPRAKHRSSHKRSRPTGHGGDADRQLSPPPLQPHTQPPLPSQHAPQRTTQPGSLVSTPGASVASLDTPVKAADAAAAAAAAAIPWPAPDRTGGTSAGAPLDQHSEPRRSPRGTGRGGGMVPMSQALHVTVQGAFPPGEDPVRPPPPAWRPVSEPVTWEAVPARPELPRELLGCTNVCDLESLVQHNSHQMNHTLVRCSLVRLAQLTYGKPIDDLFEKQSVSWLLVFLGDLLMARSGPASAQQQQQQQQQDDDVLGDSSNNTNSSSDSSSSSSSNGHDSFVGDMLRRYNAVELTAIACALGRLRLYRNVPLLRGVFEAARDLVPSMTPSNASGTLWALSRAHCQHGLPVPPDLPDALLDRIASDLPSAAPRELSAALVAAAWLRHRPQPAWMEAYLAHVHSRLEQYGGHEMSNTLWALATLGLHPGEQWMDDCLQRADVAVRSFQNGNAVANTLWALATLRHYPSGGWMRHFLWQVQRRLSTCDAQNLSNILWAVARLGYCPDTRWISLVARCGAQAKRMGSASPQAIAISMWAFAMLEVRDGIGTWLRFAYRALHQQLPAAKTRDLAQVLWALGRLPFGPHVDFLSALMESVVERLPTMTPSEALVMLEGLAALSRKLRTRADLSVVHFLADRALGAPALVARMPPRLLQNTARNLAKLELRAPPAFLKALLALLNATLPEPPPVAAGAPAATAMGSGGADRGVAQRPERGWRGGASSSSSTSSSSSSSSEASMHQGTGRHSTGSSDGGLLEASAVPAGSGWTRAEVDEASAPDRSEGSAPLAPPLSTPSSSPTSTTGGDGHDASFDTRSPHPTTPFSGAAPTSANTARSLKASQGAVKVVANLCWSMCTLVRLSGDFGGLHDRRLLPRVAAYLDHNLAVCNFQDLAQVVAAFADVDFHPGDEWLRRHEFAATRVLKAMGGVGRPALRALLIAYQRLGHYPEFLHRVAPAAASAAAAAGGSSSSSDGPRDDYIEEQSSYSFRASPTRTVVVRRPDGTVTMTGRYSRTQRKVARNAQGSTQQGEQRGDASVSLRHGGRDGAASQSGQEEGQQDASETC